MKAHRFKMTSIVLMMLVGMMFMGISCTEKPLVEDYKMDEGIPVKIQINFKVPQLDTPQAVSERAVEGNSKQVRLNLNEATDENRTEKKVETRAEGKPLYNLWVFQFDAQGKARKATKISTTDKPLNENVTIDVELFTGQNQTIYLLSLGKQYEDKDLTGIKTLADLESTSFDFVRYENGLPIAIITNEEDIPYRGSWSGVTIMQLEKDGLGYVDYKQSSDFNGGIKMQALVSLVTFDCSYSVTGMTPFILQMNNVPTTFAVNDDTYKPSQFVNLPAIEFTPADLSGSKRYVAKWYVAPNRQGTVSDITSETDRYFYYTSGTNSLGKAPRDGTYIQFWASKDDNPTNYALYYIFLGSNLTNDFNVNPHSHYRYRTDINTADAINDKRIVFKTLKQSIDFVASDNTLGYPSGLVTDSSYDLLAYSEMRPLEITALRGTITVEILAEGTAGASPINLTDTWLRLSTYPNYTAAFNGQRSGDATALTTAITLNASIPGLFRLYLYSDEYEKYVSDLPNNHKRSLFIRFKFQTSTGVANTYIVRMDQRPAFYLGQFGGEFISNDNEAYYSEGLSIVDLPSLIQYNYLSYMPSSLRIPRAYTNISEQDIIKYGGYNIYDGKTATINMAENKYGLSALNKGTPVIQIPRYVNGHVDLYQYKYYTGDGFAQRWCYDRNRDEDGNGYLTDDEIKWYWGSANQMLSIPLNYSASSNYINNPSNGGITTSAVSAITMDGDEEDGIIYSTANFQRFSDSWDYMRCVRNVPIQEGAPKKGIRYYVENGYAVIDASGLLDGVVEDRVNSSDLYIQPSDHPLGDPAYKGRVKRFYKSMSTIDYKVSKRFRVAPTDIKVNGDPTTTYVHMTWAEAAGYNTAVNTRPIDSNVDDIAPTGCVMYKGKDGMDTPGTWRLPTLREAMIIGMMDETMRNKNAGTGYVGLSNLQFNPWVNHYWIASEEKDGSSEYYKNRASSFSIKIYSYTKYNKSIYRLGTGRKGINDGSGKYGARCIQDLH